MPHALSIPSAVGSLHTLYTSITGRLARDCPSFSIKILHLGNSLRHKQYLYMWDYSFFLSSFSYSLSYLSSSVIKAGNFSLTPLPFPIFLTQAGLTLPLYALRTHLLHSTILIVFLIINLFLWLFD